MLYNNSPSVLQPSSSNISYQSLQLRALFFTFPTKEGSKAQFAVDKSAYHVSHSVPTIIFLHILLNCLQAENRCSSSCSRNRCSHSRTQHRHSCSSCCSTAEPHGFHANFRLLFSVGLCCPTFVVLSPLRGCFFRQRTGNALNAATLSASVHSPLKASREPMSELVLEESLPALAHATPPYVPE